MSGGRVQGGVAPGPRSARGAPPPPKVKFQDEHREHYLFENSALRSKLQSKVDALAIVARELDKCRSERDQLKLVTEQLQMARRPGGGEVAALADYGTGTGNLAKLLADTTQTNKALRLELESVRQRLAEADGDVRVLRKQLGQQRQCSTAYSEAHLFPLHQREQLVGQLEKSEMKAARLQADLQSLLDEKEEVVKERDAFKCKVHRLNHELAVLLQAEHGSLLDGDALITENKYLHERLQHAESEARLVSQALVKYKGLLGSRRQQPHQPADLVMTHRQVGQLLGEGRPAAPVDLKPLCLGLLEALNDKSTALAHQRKANRILADRLADLEQRLERHQGLSAFPSRALLLDYSGADVDQRRRPLQLQQPDHESEPEEPEQEPEREQEQEQEQEHGTEQQQQQQRAPEDDGPLPPQLQRLVDEARRELDG